MVAGTLSLKSFKISLLLVKKLVGALRRILKHMWIKTHPENYCR